MFEVEKEVVQVWIEVVIDFLARVREELGRWGRRRGRASFVSVSVFVSERERGRGRGQRLSTPSSLPLLSLSDTRCDLCVCVRVCGCVRVSAWVDG